MVLMETYSKEKYPDLDKSNIVEIRGIKLWYVYEGRNAWHSTWLSRYYEGCMHHSFSAAKYFAETLRTQGTVFFYGNQKQLDPIISNGYNPIPCYT